MTDQESNPIAHARGVLEVQADTYRRQRDKTLDALEHLLAALDEGQQRDIDVAIRRGVIVANTLKDKP